MPDTDLEDISEELQEAIIELWESLIRNSHPEIENFDNIEIYFEFNCDVEDRGLDFDIL